MRCVRPRRLFVVAALAGVLVRTVFAASPPPQVATPDLVDIRAVDPTIIIDLRYATANNAARRPIYSPQMQALARPDVARRLAFANRFLRMNHLRLKIWDAYRPKAAQALLWASIRNDSYVANPADGIGSMHTRGAAVDATLADEAGRDLEMPTDFDSFTPAALLTYTGNNARVKANLTMLQRAMARAGFYGLRTEWWHFCAADWTKYQPIENIDLTTATQRAIR